MEILNPINTDQIGLPSEKKVIVSPAIRPSMFIDLIEIGYTLPQRTETGTSGILKIAY